MIKGRAVDISGNKYNSWEVVYKDETREGSTNYYWWCICKCGRVRSVLGCHLKSGASTKCRKCSEDRVYPICNRQWGHIKWNAKVRKIDLLISREYAYSIWLEQQNKCALSGINISLARNDADYRWHKHTASLDRKDSSLPYQEGNIQWVHKTLNVMKGSMSDEQFKTWCKLVANNEAGISASST